MTSLFSCLYTKQRASNLYETKGEWGIKSFIYIHNDGNGSNPTGWVIIDDIQYRFIQYRVGTGSDATFEKLDEDGNPPTIVSKDTVIWDGSAVLQNQRIRIYVDHDYVGNYRHREIIVPMIEQESDVLPD